MEGKPKLRITTWSDYQHYKDRRPPWIKLHTALLDDYDLMQLRASSKWLACSLLLVAANNDNSIPNDPKWIAKKVALNTVQVTSGLEELVKVGFLEPFADHLASGAPATRYPSRARGETEAETEAEKKPPLVPLPGDGVQEVYDCWRSERQKTNARYNTISSARRQKIVTRLREFSTDELERAIRAVALDPWEERSRHDDLTIIFRSREQVEKFLSFAEDPPAKNGRYGVSRTALVDDVRAMVEQERRELSA